MRYILILLIIFGITVYLLQTKQINIPISTLPSPTIFLSPEKQVLGNQTKTIGCTTQNSLQDTACSPGAIFPEATKDQICTPGYSKSVRNVPVEEKNQVYAEYGITSHKTGQYEVDHLISLELGGSNDISNLWPEAAEPRPGFHEKDQVENYLHNQVCSGKMSLQDAQQQIAKNWLDLYRQIPNRGKYDFNTKR